MTVINKQQTIVQEVKAVLLAKGPLSTLDMIDDCPTAEDTRTLSRIIYDLKSTGAIELDPVPGKPGRDGRPSKRYRWVAKDDARVMPVRPRVKAPEPENNGAESFRPTETGTPLATVTTNASPEEIREIMDIMKPAEDPTETALAELVDHADEAMLMMADAMLAGDPLWTKLRAMSNAAHDALLDYRVIQQIAKEDKQ